MRKPTQVLLCLAACRGHGAIARHRTDRHVTVAARNPVQRALAYTLGASSLTLDELPEKVNSFDIVMSSVPAPVVTPQLIDKMRPKTLVMDLAAPPGGVDLPYAEKQGHKAIWARALGRRAPITVGGSQWVGITKIMNELLKNR